MQTLVSFADNSGNYLKSLERLRYSLEATRFNGKFISFNNYTDIGSPPHKDIPDTAPCAIPYAFKAYSIKKAADIQDWKGLLLWCDSPVYATKSIQPIFDQIKKDGYIFFDNIGYSIGDYTSDKCLKNFWMGREESFKSKMIMGCVMGFDLENETAKNFLEQYIEAASDGVSYEGSWTNENGEVSIDPRVKGHRHDQSVASITVKQMGLKITNGQSTHFAYTSHKGLVQISDTVCMWSEGM